MRDLRLISLGLFAVPSLMLDLVVEGGGGGGVEGGGIAESCNAL